jgi:23S rRNA G2445 N2-methylase RlmL
VAGRQALFGLQLAPTRLRDRPYRRASVPGGLEATVAYDMARLAAVGRDQVCLDPMCGGGTLLIEAGLAFGPRRLIGGDCWRPALAATRQNASAAGVAVATIGWDAGGLPIRDASVDVALCNLPYGKRVDAPVDEGAVLRELARVLRPGGPAVLLAGPSSRMEALLGGAPFALRRRLRLRLRGVDPRLLVLERGRGA